MKTHKQEHALDFNDQFLAALNLLENTHQNVFITGRAGTGKSTLLNYFRENTEKNIAVLAPTGVAAVNIKGQTVHSFFKFKPNVTMDAIKKEKKKETLYQKLDAIIIDEISMVRADLLDCVDRFLRLNGKDENKPFGGIQMLFIGDLYQLPPVVASQEREIFRSHYATPYFFSAHCFQDFDMELIELEKIYRQKDTVFIDLLNSIRNNSITEEGLAAINQRYNPDFEPPADDFYIYLTPTNALAKIINDKQLEKTKGKAYAFCADVSGTFGQEYFPTSLELILKIDAQIMMLNNDAGNRWINGTIGKVIDVAKDESGDQFITVKLEDGNTVDVYPYQWEIYKFYLEDSLLKSEAVGTFTQYPLMLAWALTIHKSQGKTFDKVVFDIGNGSFAHGQTYVALSRCTSLQGIVLKKPLSKGHIWMDHNVVRFLTKYQYQKSEALCSAEEKMELIKKAIHNQEDINIIYLKANDEKSRRVLKPRVVGPMEYSGKTYLGMEAFCHARQETRMFRVDRILEILQK